MDGQQKLNFRSLGLELAVTVLVAMVICTSNHPQDDTWRHLALGREFIKLGGFPVHDPFAFSIPSVPFIDFSWLSCLVFYCVYSLAGVSGLNLFASFVTGLTFFVGMARPQKTTAFRVCGIVVVVSLVGLAIRWRITPRPEIFGLFFFVALQRVLNASLKWKAVWTFILVLIWNNLHATGILAPAMCLSFAAGAYFSKTGKESVRAYLICAAVASAALFVNPWGHRLVLESFKQALHPFNLGIAEFKPLPLVEWFPLRAPLLIAGGVAYLVFAGGNKIAVFRTPTFMWVTALSLKYARCLPYSYFLTVGSVLGVLEREFRNTSKNSAAIIWIGTSAIFLGSLGIATQRSYGYTAVVDDHMRAIEFLLQTPVKGKILNDFANGGYIAWRANDRFSIFIDNRSPLYVDEVLYTYANLSNPQICQSTLNRYDVEAVVLPMTNYCPAASGAPGSFCGLQPMCFQGKDWTLVFWTDKVAVLIRNRAQYQAFNEAHGYRWINPYPPDKFMMKVELAGVLNEKGSAPNVEAELLRAHSESPADPRVNRMLEIYRELTGKNIAPK